MAIEINQSLPKKNQSPAFIFFLIAGIVLLILSGVGYFYLQNLNEKADSALQKIDQQIFQIKNDDFKNTEKDVLDWGQKIKDYNNLFVAHRAPSNILLILEKDIHPQIKLNGFNFTSASSNNTNGTIITGIANNFISLQQQIIIFSKESFIEKINLSKVSLAKDGKIIFELGIGFSPETLTPKTLK